MSAGPQPDNGGGSSGPSLTDIFWSYVDADNPNLLAKIDFLGLISRFGRAGFYGLMAALVGIPLAIVGAFVEVVDAAALAFFEAPAAAFVRTLGNLQAAAMAAARGEVAAFELFGLPVSAVAALGPALVIAVVIYLAWGEG